MYVWTKTKRGGIPRSWVVLHSWCGPDPKEPKPGFESRKLVGAAACRANLRRKGLVPSGWCKIVRPDFFWHWLEAQSVGGRVTWIIGEDILRTLWLLEWPKLVTSGEWLLSDRAKPKGDADESTITEAIDTSGLCLIEPARTIIHGRFRGGRFNIVDLANYYPDGTLPKCGGCEGEGAGDRPSSDSSLSAVNWCQARCLGTVGAIDTAISVWQKHDLGAWKYTLPALAASAYRRQFLEVKIRCHECEWASDIERAAYYDGRVQPMFRGDVLPADQPLTGEVVGGTGRGRPSVRGPVYHVDMNSFYPSVMHDHWYPVAALCDSKGEPMVYTGLRAETLRMMLDRYCCVAHVLLKTEHDLYPYRVPRDRQDGKGKLVARSAASAIAVPDSTIYPVGKFDTVLCTPELEMALTRGAVQEVYDVLLYERAKPFRKWVEFWCDERRKAKESGDPTAAAWYKAIACGLTGKFGQKRRGWRNTAQHEAPEPWVGWPWYDARTKTRKLLRSVGWQVQESVDYGTARSALVALSAHISSHARVAVRRALDCISRHDCLYVANDALLVTQAGLIALESAGLCHPTEMGRFGQPRAFDAARIWGCRDYELDGKLVKSGLPAKRIDQGNRRWLARFAERGDALLSHPLDGAVRFHWSIVLGDNGDEPGLWHENGWYIPPKLGEGKTFTLDTKPRVGYTSSATNGDVPKGRATLNPEWGWAKPRRGIRS